MSSVAWYWHRLKAMSAAELAAHARRKAHQVSDRILSGRRFAKAAAVGAGRAFPVLPPRETAPELVRRALARDVADILQGRWIAFGYLPLPVETPPRWHKDYLSGVDMATNKPALKLHHRLEGDADIKLIWEPNRWYSLLRLAQAAYVLDHRHAAEQCLAWLEDWIKNNPPYYGWNWTSGLESGLRLVQFAWIDALLSAAPANGGNALSARLSTVRSAVLLPHAWFTWRDRSFGSSANNHVLGELAGLILSLVRWPELASWAAPLDVLQRHWEREVLAQFAPDGGNREQALNYHLFGWEFCWQASLALRAAGQTVSPEVEDRLRAAASFFTAVQVEEKWDYGDSDDAYVTPFFADWDKAASEWRRWLAEPESSPAIRYWIGDPPKPFRAPGIITAAKQWRIYPESGFALFRDENWFLRWDLSPLGYLSTAGHGHCDALHLSMWYQGQPVLIDPGTGAYHFDRPLRDYLSSWEAHNGPHPVPANFPERRGAFLWSARHELPQWKATVDGSLTAKLRLPAGIVRRTITRLESDGWQVDDGFEPAAGTDPVELQVLWQFAPRAVLHQAGPTGFCIQAGSVSIDLECDPAWRMVEAWHPGAPRPLTAHPLVGVCSHAFRQVESGPFVRLTGSGVRGTVLRNSFSPKGRASA